MLRDILKKINLQFERYIILLAPLGAILGLLLGKRLGFMSHVSNYLLAFMSFMGSLSISFSDFRKSIDFRAIAVQFSLRHIILPLVSIFLLKLLFSSSEELFVGLLLMYVGPCASTSFLWASIFGGNRSLSIIMVVFDSLISFLVMPFTIRLVCGAAVQINVLSISINLFLIVVVPSILGILANRFIPHTVIETADPYVKVVTKTLLLLLIAYSVSLVSDSIKGNFNYSVLFFILYDFVFCIFSFFIGFFLGKRFLKMDISSSISLSFAVGQRNLGLLVVLAGSYFPPIAILPPVMGLFYQEIVTSNAGRIEQKILKKEELQNNEAKAADR